MARATKCIFCGGGPLSKEHVLGRWMTPAFATPPPGKKMYADAVKMRDGVVTRQNRRFPKEIDFQIRCVCEKCNSGWMSGMEEAVKPLIESLQRDSIITLSKSDQSMLAKWAVKTAIIARYFEGDHEIPIRYRRWIYERQTVPPNTFVWIGAYDDELAVSMQTKDMSFRDLNGQTLSFSHAQFVVFAAGRLLVCVLSVFVNYSVSIEYKGLMRKHLKVIDPYRGDILWPIDPVDTITRNAIYETNWDNMIVLKIPKRNSKPSS